MRRTAFLASSAFGFSLAASPAAHAQDDWKFSITPYLWIAGVDAKMATTSDLPTVSYSQDFGDIIDMAQLALMGKFEASSGPIHLIGELSYIDIGSSTQINNADYPNLTAASIGSETFLGTGAAGYRVYQENGNSFDVIAGIRYTWTKSDINFDLADDSVITSGEDENWADTFIGVRGEMALSPQWSLAGYGDLGAGQSDYTWQLYAGANYALNPGTVLFGGYRAFKDKYDNDGYLYNITQSGPIFGATFRL